MPSRHQVSSADTKDGIAQVLLTREANVNLDQDWLQEFPIHFIERAFITGDYIRVLHGVHAGIRGHVVEVDRHTLKVIALQSDNLEFSPNLVSTFLML